MYPADPVDPVVVVVLLVPSLDVVPPLAAILQTYDVVWYNPLQAFIAVTFEPAENNTWKANRSRWSRVPDGYVKKSWIVVAATRKTSWAIRSWSVVWADTIVIAATNPIISDFIFFSISADNNNYTANEALFYYTKCVLLLILFINDMSLYDELNRARNVNIYSLKKRRYLGCWNSCSNKTFFYSRFDSKKLRNRWHSDIQSQIQIEWESYYRKRTNYICNHITLTHQIAQ